MIPTDNLELAAQRLYQHVSHWTNARWSRVDSTGLSKAEVMHRLLQQLADLAAVAEGGQVRKVPRLASDIALADQLVVLAHDLAITDNDQLQRQGYEAITAVSGEL